MMYKKIGQPTEGGAYWVCLGIKRSWMEDANEDANEKC